uniref:Pyridine nucleotide-disulfide oxidoreductase domain-containing protein 1 n=1 Tax=Syphacia muris TaxID=451379 RepID=A0A0N5ASH6_9BILA
MAKFYPYVIVGGGVSAVCCTQELIACDDSEKRIALISAGTLLKVVTNKIPIGQLLQSFDISEESAFQTFTDENRVVFIRGKVIGWKWREKIIRLDDGQEIAYEKLCICTGGRPKNQPSHPLVVSLRDTATIEELDKKVHSARRVVVIGNGGIATEVVFVYFMVNLYELKNVEIIWAIRHSSISATFFDEGAAEFFKPMLLYGQTKKEESVAPKRFKITVNEDGSRDDTASFALGPDWASYCDITGCLQKRSVHVIYEVEMKEILDSSTEIIPTVKSSYFEGNWPLFVKLSDEQVVGCDLLIHATGVDPNSALWKSECSELELADDNGILVDEHMMTSIPDVYACGDVCSAGWQWSKHWMQMRLWTQAYQMGAYCGRCMAIPDVSLDFCFELFTHVTKFFGYKVIFLGKFNGIGIEKPWHVLMRISKGSEYIKLIVKDGRVQGAVLIGKTDLEETIENLILNQIDITDVEDGLLDPNIGIDDFFD